MGMLTLQSFPFRNQLHDVATADGQGDENRSYNCVPTSLAACIQWFDGIVVGADKLKDQVYGQGHVGGGDELRYGPLLAQAPYNLRLSVDYQPSASQALIDALRSYLRRQIPCIVTMHSQWSRVWSSDIGDGYHVGVAHSIDESDSGNLHIMNPWGGFDHVQPVSWWRARLGIGVYPVERAGLGLGLERWKDDGSTLTAPNGHVVVKGFREKVLADARSADGWRGGEPYEEEWGDATGTRQLFASAELWWTPATGVQVATMEEVLALAAHLREGKSA